MYLYFGLKSNDAVCHME